jgi:ribonucleoside-diphosphate reductase alpha chain
LASHELVITKNNIQKFANKIGFADPEKSSKLKKVIDSHEKRGFYEEKYVAKVTSITEGSLKDVYDCSIPDVNCFKYIFV